MLQTSNIEKIISRQLLGEKLTGEEQKQLQTWLDESERNHRLYDNKYLPDTGKDAVG